MLPQSRKHATLGLSILRMKPAPRPFLVTLFFSLLAGAGFSIVLAVGFAAWSDDTPALQAIRNKAFTTSAWDTDFLGSMLPMDPNATARFDRLIALEQTVWTPRSGVTEFSTYQSILVRAGAGFEVEEFQSIFHYTTATGGVGSESAGVLSYRAGWPFKCLRTHQWSPNGPPPPPPGNRVLPGGGIGTPAPPLPWFHAADYPAFLINPNSAIERKVPLVPAWPGLLANTAIYSGLILLTFPVRHAVVRWNRRRRNHCLVCNYDRRGLEPSDRCPECGTTNEPKTSSR